MPAGDGHGGVAAVDRAFAILGAFRDTDRALTLAELGRRTGLYKSTILRLIGSIERAGLLRRQDDGRYAIGAAALQLARLYQASFDLDPLLLPVLRELAHASGETASFYIRDRDKRLCLRRVEPERSVRSVLHEGDRLPLDSGSAGRVLLAFADGRRPPAPLIGTRGERDPDAGSISAPVFRNGRELAGALSLSGPIDRFDPPRTKRFARLLLAAAARLTEALGGEPHRPRPAAARG